MKTNVEVVMKKIVVRKSAGFDPSWWDFSHW